MWINLTGGEGPKTQKERHTTKGMVLGAYPCRLGLQVVEPPESPVDSSGFQWVPVGSSGSRGLGSPPGPQQQLLTVVVAALRHSAVDSTPRAVDQLDYRASGL